MGIRSLIVVAALAAAGCASSVGTLRPPAPAAGQPPISLQIHAYEVPRIPHPGYHRDGMQVTRVDGDSAFAKAGLRPGDIVETVNGGSVVCDYDEENFWRLAGSRNPSKVKVVASRMGIYGSNLVSLEVTP